MAWPTHPESLLSGHFKRREFSCPCCGEMELEPLLLVGLEWLRRLVGKAVTINSGYRCAAHNRAVGGETDSQHMSGRAADIVVSGMTPARLKDLAQQIPYFNDGGIGLYKTFVHVDVRGRRARW